MPNNFVQISECARRILVEQLRLRREVFAGSSFFDNCVGILDDAIAAAEDGDIGEVERAMNALSDYVKKLAAANQ